MQSPTTKSLQSCQAQVTLGRWPQRSNACVARLGNQGGCLEGITGFAQRQIDRISGQYQEVADSCLVRDRDGNFTSGLLSWLEVMRVRGHAFASSVFPVA